MKKYVTLILASLVLYGCAWTGEISKDFYVPESTYTTEKVPLTLGLIVKKTPKEVRYGMSVDYRLNINNYIYALQKELGQHFNDVKLVKTMEECPDCSLFAESRAKVKLQQVQETYDAYLDCDFILRNGKKLVQISSHSEGDASPSAALRVKTGVNGAMLGLLAASTINDYGQMITAVSESALTEVISDLGKKVQTNPYLEHHALLSILQIYPESKSDSSPSSSLSTSGLGASKYQKYIDATLCVVTPDGGFGSAFAITENGKLLTNAHVVGKWSVVKIEFPDGRRVAGIVDKVDYRRDIAVILTKENTPKYLRLGHERDFSVGDKVIAVGAPSKLRSSVTAGIISQSRNFIEGRQIQTDADINPGNSGGPLICERTGTVVGINTTTLVRNPNGTRVTGINFAVSVDEVRDFLGLK